MEEAKLCIKLNSGNRGSGLFADDFVGVSDSKEKLQKLIDVVHRFYNRWRLKASICKKCCDGI